MVPCHIDNFVITDSDGGNSSKVEKNIIRFKIPFFKIEKGKKLAPDWILDDDATQIGTTFLNV